LTSIYRTLVYLILVRPSISDNRLHVDKGVTSRIGRTSMMVQRVVVQAPTSSKVTSSNNKVKGKITLGANALFVNLRRIINQCDKFKQKGKWPPKHVSSAAVKSHGQGTTGAVNKTQRAQADTPAAHAQGSHRVSVNKVAFDSAVASDSSVGLVTGYWLLVFNVA